VFIVGIPLKVAVGLFFMSLVVLQFDPVVRQITMRFMPPPEGAQYGAAARERAPLLRAGRSQRVGIASSDLLRSPPARCARRSAALAARSARHVLRATDPQALRVLFTKLRLLLPCVAGAVHSAPGGVRSEPR
jgi:hypothetical protein